MIYCGICHRELQSLKSLARHIYHSHKSTTIKQYYDEFLKEDEGQCLTCNGDTKFSGLGNGYQDHCSKSCAQHDPNLIKKRNIKLGIDSSIDPPVNMCRCGCGQKTLHSNTFYCKGHANRNAAVKLKKIETSRVNNGYDNPFQSEKIKTKIKNTCILKYGTENPFQSDIIKEKYKNTCMRRYGVQWSMQSVKVQEKSKQSCMTKFGYDNYSKTPQGRQIARENFIRMIENEKLNGETLCGRVGDIERPCLNELQKHIEIEIIRNPQIIGYIPDGYIMELNLLIEFDERHHFIDNYQTYRDHDIQKDEDYKRSGFNLIRIKKNDWIDNPDKVVNNFITKLKEITNACHLLHSSY